MKNAFLTFNPICLDQKAGGGERIPADVMVTKNYRIPFFTKLKKKKSNFLDSKMMIEDPCSFLLSR